MLLPKRIADLTADDIKEFARKFPEGLRVEYKADLTQSVRNKVPAIVSSFGNSFGGVLIIGIKTQLGTPVEPFEGYENPSREELGLTVQNLCLQNINPPISPRTRQIAGDVPGKSFLIVEVDESREAPHAIENSRKVYVRTGDSQTPFDIADISTIQRLLERRKDTSARRSQLTIEGESLARRYWNLSAAPLLSLVVTPFYPAVPLAERETIYKFLLGVSGLKGKVFRHPDGACAIREDPKDDFELWKISKYGHIFALDILQSAKGEQFGGFGNELGGEEEVYPFAWILGHLHRVLPAAGNLYKVLQFEGDVQVEAWLRNVHGRIFAGGQSFLATKLSSVANDVPASSICVPSGLPSFDLLTNIFYQLL